MYIYIYCDIYIYCFIYILLYILLYIYIVIYIYIVTYVYIYIYIYCAYRGIAWSCICSCQIVKYQKCPDDTPFQLRLQEMEDGGSRGFTRLVDDNWLTLVILCYPLVMTNSSPWKITMLLIGKPSINEPSIPWRTVT